ncbi:hypothetical protein JCM10207_006596 [Rhodosporidiobolus poonsookiae]
MAEEATISRSLLGAPDDEYSDLQQYLEWPTTSIAEECDRRKSLFNLIETEEEKHFREFVQEVKAKVPDTNDTQGRLSLVEEKALATTHIPPRRRRANWLLRELKRVEDDKGHGSRDFLVALHDFHNEELLLYQLCVRSEALYDFLEVLEDKLLEGAPGHGAKGRLPRPRFL